MAEGSNIETTPVGTPTEAGQAQPSAPEETTKVTAPQSPEPSKRSLIGRVFGGLFGGGKKQEAGAPQVEPEKKPQQIVEELSKLYTERSALVNATKYPDSTGSTKAMDADRIGVIDEKIAQLKSQLPSEPATGGQSPDQPPTAGPVSEGLTDVSAPTPEQTPVSATSAASPTATDSGEGQKAA